MPKEKAEQKTKTLDVTINLHKLCHRATFKKKAKKAISQIKITAGKMMDTPQDVRIETKLNKFVWSKGIRNIPRRVRVRMSRKRNEDEEAEHPVSASPGSLHTRHVADARVASHVQRAMDRCHAVALAAASPGCCARSCCARTRRSAFGAQRPSMRLDGRSTHTQPFSARSLQFFTLVQHVQVPTYKGLTTEVVHE